MGTRYTHLTEEERNQIYALKQVEKSIRQFAVLMQRSPSAISR